MGSTGKISSFSKTSNIKQFPGEMVWFDVSWTCCISIFLTDFYETKSRQNFSGIKENTQLVLLISSRVFSPSAYSQDFWPRDFFPFERCDNWKTRAVAKKQSFQLFGTDSKGDANQCLLYNCVFLELSSIRNTTIASTYASWQ
jgi:hypothetical protein